jgi:hypothetical protein
LEHVVVSDAAQVNVKEAKVDAYKTLEIAKSGKLSRSALYAEISSLAEAQREPGQSTHQAFAKFIASYPGKELLQIQQSLPGNDVEPTSFIPVAKSTNVWNDLIDAMARHTGCSRTVAIDKLLKTDEGRAVFNAVRRKEKIASGFTVGDMERDDNEQAAREATVAKVIEPGSEFMALVDDLMDRRPGLTRSQAMDYIRSTPAGQKAWQKFTRLRFVPPSESSSRPHSLPEASMREVAFDTTPLWPARHYSGPNTPARTPIRADNTPTVKSNPPTFEALMREVQVLKRLRQLTR